MRTENYIRLKETLGAYRTACDALRADPTNEDYAEAVDGTQYNLFGLLDDLLWEECPEDMRPEINPNELPL